MESSCYCNSEAQMLKLGQQLAQAQLAGCCIYLEGDLGAGKTTLVRAALHAAGVMGSIHSPTYAIVETYDEIEPSHYHFDLYRLHSPWELEEIGFEEYFTSTSCCWVEWPDKAKGLLPEPDLTITIEHQEDSRHLRFTSNSPQGHNIIKALNEGP